MQGLLLLSLSLAAAEPLRALRDAEGHWYRVPVAVDLTAGQSALVGLCGDVEERVDAATLGPYRIPPGAVDAARLEAVSALRGGGAPSSLAAAESKQDAFGLCIDPTLERYYEACGLPSLQQVTQDAAALRVLLQSHSAADLARASDIGARSGCELPFAQSAPRAIRAASRSQSTLSAERAEAAVAQIERRLGPNVPAHEEGPLGAPERLELRIQTLERRIPETQRQIAEAEQALVRLDEAIRGGERWVVESADERMEPRALYNLVDATLRAQAHVHALALARSSLQGDQQTLIITRAELAALRADPTHTLGPMPDDPVPDFGPATAWTSRAEVVGSWLIDRFPNAKERPEVMLWLAQTLQQEVSDLEGASAAPEEIAAAQLRVMVWYQRLAREQPASEEAAIANAELGFWHWRARDDHYTALVLLEKAAAGPPSRTALWSATEAGKLLRQQLQAPAEARDLLLRSLRRAEASPETRGEARLWEESLHELARSLAVLDEADAGWEYLGELAADPVPARWELARALATEHRAEGAERVYRRLLDQSAGTARAARLWVELGDLLFTATTEAGRVVELRVPDAIVALENAAALMEASPAEAEDQITEGLTAFRDVTAKQVQELDRNRRDPGYLNHALWADHERRLAQAWTRALSSPLATRSLEPESRRTDLERGRYLEADALFSLNRYAEAWAVYEGIATELEARRAPTAAQAARDALAAAEGARRAERTAAGLSSGSLAHTPPSPRAELSNVDGAFVSAAERVLRLSPLGPAPAAELLGQVGDTYWSRGQVPEARAAYRRALGSDPGGPGSVAALDDLFGTFDGDGDWIQAEALLVELYAGGELGAEATAELTRLDPTIRLKRLVSSVETGALEPSRAADAAMALGRTTPDVELAEKALWNASDWYRKAGRLESAIDTRALYLRRFDLDPVRGASERYATQMAELAADARSLNRLALLADTAERLARRFPEHPNAVAAWADAAEARLSLEQSGMAAKDLLLLLRRHPTNEGANAACAQLVSVFRTRPKDRALLPLADELVLTVTGTASLPAACRVALTHTAGLSLARAGTDPEPTWGLTYAAWEEADTEQRSVPMASQAMGELRLRSADPILAQALSFHLVDGLESEVAPTVWFAAIATRSLELNAIIESLEGETASIRDETRDLHATVALLDRCGRAREHFAKELASLAPHPDLSEDDKHTFKEKYRAFSVTQNARAVAHYELVLSTMKAADEAGLRIPDEEPRRHSADRLGGLRPQAEAP